MTPKTVNQPIKHVAITCDEEWFEHGRGDEVMPNEAFTLEEARRLCRLHATKWGGRHVSFRLWAFARDYKPKGIKTDDQMPSQNRSDFGIDVQSTDNDRGQSDHNAENAQSAPLQNYSDSGIDVQSTDNDRGQSDHSAENTASEDQK